MSQQPTIPRALTVAGSDSGGGAGIQADLKTFSAFRVYGASVLTAITAQNSIGVHGVVNLPPEFVARQLDVVLGDIGADAAKTGMLSTAPIIRAVADRMRAHGLRRLVVDPVMVAKSGDPLLEPDARAALVEAILPLALVVTPNLPEAAALAEFPVATLEEMEAAARRIHTLGPAWVLVKGGHLKDDPVDLLFDGRTVTRLSAARVNTPHTHGTGCAYSAAIAAGLARGQGVPDAVAEAKRYVTAAIRAGFALGRGVGTLRHFIDTW
ncbi:MAG TPA: bifunctional hydroxymethylpyrimidine kinase/phosphomethylpyrimidine kinase [Methylomirabilota bacterium]|jgi:hydroxymethylpyrimidine/phosphomethylpyrimidine kinase|nr:bifunctional hydroxymethylpyrimidine kinase/phosphomethylpyrimidine kinase [Methylomirabilota bacterium]